MNAAIVHAAPRTGGTTYSDLSLGARVLRTLRTWHQRRSDRAHLAELDARLLADAGLTPRQAAIESGKPFWRA